LLYLFFTRSPDSYREQIASPVRYSWGEQISLFLFKFKNFLLKRQVFFALGIEADSPQPDEGSARTCSG